LIENNKKKTAKLKTLVVKGKKKEISKQVLSDCSEVKIWIAVPKLSRIK
jgi:hypothetical protein